MANLSHPSELVLLGFSSLGGLQALLYGPFLTLYLLAFMGNAIIIIAVIADTHLHTPMYFFLGNFSLLEVLLTMTTVPRMLSDLPAPPPRVIPSLAAWSSSTFTSLWVPPPSSSCQTWPSTALWPSATHCATAL